jgi:NTP-dependent ternary system trypsin peptidase co-occuring protein
MRIEKPKLLKVKPAQGKDPISIEVTEVEGETGGVVQAGGGKISFEDMLGKVKPFCESIIKNFEGLSKKPDSASAEFGLKISAEGNLFIVKASGEATLKITLNWSLKR